MGLFSRRRRGTAAPGASEAPPTGRAAREETLAHLREFATSRVGVEAYLEPQTNVTQTTLMLIATDGEWTRRRVPDPKAGYELARTLGLPVYDVQRTGYPQRMRDWNSRQRIERQRAQRERAARRSADPR
ncbi:oxidoreductase [Cellulomonas triticagri]|uniref:Oxidoreductase n=1 Tax=Cellulomonas triticagri TaxID=2483352 RepID=A0A3M2JU88_9CELL|nr:oxidoreductase [Cellulomonas triticagri]RMI14325.1 oxidoreductase [Cellulomonas triticagri]